MKNCGDGHRLWITRRARRYARSSHPAAFESLLQQLRGAPPNVVWPLLGCRAGMGLEAKNCPANNGSYEPHPLDYDWRFTDESAEWVGALASESGDRMGLFGMPTVQRAVLRSGLRPTLVDWNPLAVAEFPGLAHRFDLCTDKLPWQGGFDSVFLDPPWYPEILLAWLQRAFLATKIDGTVGLSLWGENTRPTAARERRSILDLLAARGDVTVFKNALTYRSPLFEQAAFQAANIPAPLRWRRADLVLVKKYRKVAPIVGQSLKVVAYWHRFAFGTRQLAIRSLSVRRGTVFQGRMPFS